MAKANMDLMHTLHRKQAEYLIEAIESGEELSSGTLAAINAFLKNNEIQVDIIESSPTQDLSEKFRQMILERKEIG